jgi:hypothetical protein
MLPSGKQAFNGNILVDIGPMNSNAATKEPIVRAARGRCCVQAWEPGQRDGHLPAVSQSDAERLAQASDLHRTCLKPNR